MVLAVLSAAVVTGDARAPILVVMVVSAAVVPLLVAGRAIATPSRAATLPMLAALALVLAANLVVLGDFARLLGGPRVHGVAAGAALALVVAVGTAADRWWRLAAPLGAVMVLLPLALVVPVAGAPWTVWSAVASRPALTFSDDSPWVTQGRALGERPALTFREPHRVVAATPATWRVVERDAAHVAVREWQLRTGDGLTVRPGDELVVDADARVRFQAGRRVPGAPASGVAWADGRSRSVPDAMLTALGAAVTLVGGGVALAPAAPLAGAAVIVAPALVLAFVVGGLLWGVYAMALAPELSLVPRALAPLLEVVARLTAPVRREVLVTVLALGVVVLFLGVVLACRARVTAVIAEIALAVRRQAPSPVARAAGTAGVVALATAAATHGTDPWRLFTWGLGLAAAAAVAPRVASAGPRGELVGTAVAVVVFGIAVLADTRDFAAVGALQDYPAAVAAPLGWLAARLARSR